MVKDSKTPEEFWRTSFGKLLKFDIYRCTINVVTEAQVGWYCLVIFVVLSSHLGYAMYSSCILRCISIRQTWRSFLWWETDDLPLTRVMRKKGKRSFTICQLTPSKWDQVADSFSNRKTLFPPAPITKIASHLCLRFVLHFPFLYCRWSSFSFMITDFMRLHCWLRSSSSHISLSLLSYRSSHSPFQHPFLSFFLVPSLHADFTSS